MRKKVKMMMTIDFEKLFSGALSNGIGNQKLLDIKSVIKVYYGLNNDGCYRLASIIKRSTMASITSLSNCKVILAGSPLFI